MSHFSEVLLPEAQKIFPFLEDLPLQTFYLAGGTGLALQFGHRISLDYDLFSSNLELDYADRETLKDYFKCKNVEFAIQKDKDKTLILLLEGVQVSFFSYPYPLLKTLISYKKILLASPLDIGTMKLSAVVSRGSKKDFIDLYEIAQQIPLRHLLEAASQRYSKISDFPFQVLKALSYFEEAELEPTPRLLKPLHWEKIRSFFEKETMIIAAEWLK